jgi:hypothetical protein
MRANLLAAFLVAGVTPINPLLGLWAYGRGHAWALPLSALWGLGALAAFFINAGRKHGSIREAPDGRD